MLGQAARFSPSGVRNAYEGKSAVMQHDRALQARRSALVEQFAMAAMAGNEEGEAAARKDIAKFNEKTRTAASRLCSWRRARTCGRSGSGRRRSGTTCRASGVMCWRWGGSRCRSGT